MRGNLYNIRYTAETVFMADREMKQLDIQGKTGYHEERKLHEDRMYVCQQEKVKQILR